MARRSGRELEHAVAKGLYCEHGIVTFPCRDDKADLETLSGKRIEVKRKAWRHTARNHSIIGLQFQKGQTFDWLVVVLGGEHYAFTRDEVLPYRKGGNAARGNTVKLPYELFRRRSPGLQLIADGLFSNGLVR